MVPHFPVCNVVNWINATDQLNAPPLLMKSAALTNILHHTLIARIIPNNTSVLIHINGDNQSVTNNRLVWMTKQNNQSFELLLKVWAI